jgi:hypothetical protein
VKREEEDKKTERCCAELGGSLSRLGWKGCSHLEFTKAWSGKTPIYQGSAFWDWSHALSAASCPCPVVSSLYGVHGVFKVLACNEMKAIHVTHWLMVLYSRQPGFQRRV